MTGGPYIAAALFCEKALREPDGVLSLIRVVDRWTVAGSSDPMPLSVIQATMVILVKSGMFRGSSAIHVAPVSPTGKHLPAVEFPVLFEGDDYRGVGVVAPLAFPAQEPGTYWFEISVAGQLLTRIPLQVVYHRIGPVQLDLPNP